MAAAAAGAPAGRVPPPPVAGRQSADSVGAGSTPPAPEPPAARRYGPAAAPRASTRWVTPGRAAVAAPNNGGAGFGVRTSAAAQVGCADCFDFATSERSAKKLVRF